MNKTCFALDKHIKFRALIQRIKKIIKTPACLFLVYSIKEKINRLLEEGKVWINNKKRGNQARNLSYIYFYPKKIKSQLLSNLNKKINFYLL